MSNHPFVVDDSSLLAERQTLTESLLTAHNRNLECIGHISHAQPHFTLLSQLEAVQTILSEKLILEVCGEACFLTYMFQWLDDGAEGVLSQSQCPCWLDTALAALSNMWESKHKLLH
eukprot:PhF_6_TR20488/c0_g1_i3/m.29502